MGVLVEDAGSSASSLKAVVGVLVVKAVQAFVLQYENKKDDRMEISMANGLGALPCSALSLQRSEHLIDIFTNVLIQSGIWTTQ